MHDITWGTGYDVPTSMASCCISSVYDMVNDTIVRRGDCRGGEGGIHHVRRLDLSYMCFQLELAFSSSFPFFDLNCLPHLPLRRSSAPGENTPSSLSRPEAWMGEVCSAMMSV